MAPPPNDVDQGPSAPETESAGSPGTLPALTPPSTPVNFPGYEVLGELGRGGLGVVYLARNKAMDRLEVLKVVQPGRGDHRRFAKEIQNAARVQHPNIVIAYHTFEAGELLVLAMEYIDGSNLDVVVQRQGRLEVARACRYARQVAQGLEKAHEKGVVHRDIKPGNLMLSRDGVVKIVDFGLAKAVRERDDDQGLTDTGQMMGTPHFMAPEQGLDAKSADIRADIYSLGCTLFFLLTARPLFSGRSALEVVLAHQTKPPPALGAERPDAPAGLAALLARLVAKRPEDRPQTPGEVARALLPFCHELPREITNTFGMRLVLIPAGTFLMGSPEGEEGRNDDEPQHEVRITRPFYLGAHQVTQGQFRAVMGHNPSHFSADGTRQEGATYIHEPAGGRAKVEGHDTAGFPVENVSWHEAAELCKRLTEHERKAGAIGPDQEYRLPSEAEWEHACRGGSANQPFTVGDQLDSAQGNFDGNYPYGGAGAGPYLMRTTKVGSYPPNAFGLYDLHGNVWEWCLDWYGKDTYSAAPPPRVDPLGPAVRAARAIRGGCWSSSGQNCRSASRFRLTPVGRDSGLGFRVCLVAPGG